MFLRKIITSRVTSTVKDIINVQLNGRFEQVTRRTYTTNFSPTISELIERWSTRFENEGVPEPMESIEHIIAHILGTGKTMDVINSRNERLNPAQYEKLESLCECRLSRMPVQYIIGEWDFRDITLKLVPPVFIPRPETEILVNLVLQKLNSASSEKLEILEIGCGSGAISLSVAHSYNRVNCTAIDTSLHACALALKNREMLDLNDRVHILHGTLKENGNIELPNSNKEEELEFSTRVFDHIVSNPPYVPTKEVMKLEPEIRLFEDIRALDGGEDGLKIIKPLLHYAAVSLKPGGSLLMEVDPSHPEYIKYFTEKYPLLKLKYEHTYKDYCNKDRFIEIVKMT